MLIAKCKLATFHKGKKCYSCCCSMNHVCIKLLYLFPVQYSAKHFLIDTKDDADAMKSAEFGYGNQNKDEDAFKQILKKRKKGGGNRSPPKGCYEKAKSAPKGICCDCLEHVKLSCGPCYY